MKKYIIAVIAAIAVFAGIFLAKPIFNPEYKNEYTALSVIESSKEASLSESREESSRDELTAESASITKQTSNYKTESVTQPKTEKQTSAKTTAKTTTASAGIDRNGSYFSKDDVALYIHTYGRLPSNFITKKQAQALGWSGGSVERYAPGKAIGGDYFGNYEGTLPDGNYHECDINTNGRSSRGAERIIYSSDGRIYYTSDHYESFTRLY